MYAYYACVQVGHLMNELSKAEALLQQEQATSALTRTYRDSTARTTVVHVAKRVRLKPVRVEVPGQDKGRKQQARKGIVYGMVPNIAFKCCKRACAKHFPSALHPMLINARKPLFDEGLSRVDSRATLHRNIQAIVHPGDHRPVCLNFAMVVYNCSKDFLNAPPSQRSQGESNRDRATKSTDILSFLAEEKLYGDTMPDDGTVQIPYPSKKYLHTMFNAEKERNGEATCSVDYFKKVWTNNCPNLILRKTCRFSKCNFCVRWKKEKEVARGQSNEVARTLADRMLDGHYKWVRRERVLWNNKKQKAKRNPAK